MNLKHLGDGYDLWKGVVLDVLSSGGASGFKVVPMFSDAEKWRKEHLAAYSRFLRVEPPDILNPALRSIHRRRTKYFDHVVDGSDPLFVDPDIGLGEKADKEHLAYREFGQLTPLGSTRLVCVYQHSYRKIRYLEDRLRTLAERTPNRHLLGYWAGQVSMVLGSRCRETIELAENALREYLGAAEEVDEAGGPRLLSMKGV